MNWCHFCVFSICLTNLRQRRRRQRRIYTRIWCRSLSCKEKCYGPLYNVLLLLLGKETRWIHAQPSIPCQMCWNFLLYCVGFIHLLLLFHVFLLLTLVNGSVAMCQTIYSFWKKIDLFLFCRPDPKKRPEEKERAKIAQQKTSSFPVLQRNGTFDYYYWACSHKIRAFMGFHLRVFISIRYSYFVGILISSRVRINMTKSDKCTAYAHFLRSNSLRMAIRSWNWFLSWITKSFVLRIIISLELVCASKTYCNPSTSLFYVCIALSLHSPFYPSLFDFSFPAHCNILWVIIQTKRRQVFRLWPFNIDEK